MKIQIHTIIIFIIIQKKHIEKNLNCHTKNIAIGTIDSYGGYLFAIFLEIDHD